ncbi:hypothetical protein PW5551_06555 [Petrotoga sp. 9PW.55.5.1]|nr:hypothetical protein [Petrotoga sp. 9PW.55.5.1]RAO99010.1 hypothetical protein PW5551_06555 [Petrotoga sp. 9PW.55.5.1]
MKIAVAGTGYAGLSLAVLLSQNNEVVALDIIKEKVEMINNKKTPISDKEIEEYAASPLVLFYHFFHFSPISMRGDYGRD